MKRHYLKPNVVVEPLIDNWYAWSHLLSPATAAMNIRNRHLKIMESYVKAPQVHLSAVQDPALKGGPFIDYDTIRTEEINDLIAETRSARKQMLDMAEAFIQLDNMLRDEADGYSLEPLYKKIPDILKGYVELVYDLNDHPSYRIIEPLLYKSPFYDASRQTLMLSLINKDERPFVMSTPRLKDGKSVHMKIPFRSNHIDDLFRAKQIPCLLQELYDKLHISEEDSALFSAFFTETPPAPYMKYTGNGIRWRYFGHACILVETKNISILLDPVLSYTYDSSISRYTYQDIPDVIDYVIITHNHQDHILFETILQLRYKIRNIIVPRNGGGALQDPSLKLMLRHLGFENVIETDELEQINGPAIQITSLPFLGEHADLNVRTKSAWLVEINNRKLMFAADSNNIEPLLYERLHDLIGDVDVLFLGMECDGAPLSWLYGPLLTKPLSRDKDRSRRLAGSNYEKGIKIVNYLNCQEVYVYAMGQEPWLNHVMAIKYTEDSNPIVASNALVAECLSRNIASERLFGEKEILIP